MEHNLPMRGFFLFPTPKSLARNKGGCLSAHWLNPWYIAGEAMGWKWPKLGKAGLGEFKN